MKKLLIVLPTILMVSVSACNDGDFVALNSAEFPRLISPLHNAEVPATPLILEWEPVENASAYEIWIDGEMVGSTQETTFDLNLPDPNPVPYNWQIRARNSFQYAPSNIRQFTLLPGAPTLLSPIPNETKCPETNVPPGLEEPFTWSAGIFATDYLFELYHLSQVEQIADQGGSELVLRDGEVPLLSYWYEERSGNPFLDVETDNYLWRVISAACADGATPPESCILGGASVLRPVRISSPPTPKKLCSGCLDGVPPPDNAFCGLNFVPFTWIREIWPESQQDLTRPDLLTFWYEMELEEVGCEGWSDRIQFSSNGTIGGYATRTHQLPRYDCPVRWRVRYIEGDCLGRWSEWDEIVVHRAEIPSGFTDSYNVCEGQEITISWDGDDTGWYEVELKEQGQADAFYSSEGVTLDQENHTATFSGLQPGGYFWKLQHHVGWFCDSSFPITKLFFVIDVPDQVDVVSTPTGGNTAPFDAYLDWEDSDPENGYWFEFYDSAVGNGCTGTPLIAKPILAAGISDEQISSLPPSTNGEYCWRVRPLPDQNTCPELEVPWTPCNCFGVS